MLKRWAAWLVGGIVVVVLALAIAWLLLVPAADWLASHDVGSVTGATRAMRLQTARDAARGRLLTLGAGLLAASALIYTARSFTLSRVGQVTDRYTKAIEQLGSDKLDVRIGGIYALERVARDSAKDHPTVMEVLAAFVREHSREAWPLSEPESEDSERALRPDVQAAVTVIGRRDRRNDRQRLDLFNADLRGADLWRANLTRALLAEADLTGAYLADANLAGAYLGGADLTRARLGDANLTGAYLTDADLTGAYLDGADLTRAVLNRTKLGGAKLDDANLTGAYLGGADLTGAYLTGAKLDRAVLRGAILADADLTGAHLSRASRIVASVGLADKLLGAADLDGALLSPDEVTPEGWVRDAESGRLRRADASSGGAAAT